MLCCGPRREGEDVAESGRHTHNPCAVVLTVRKKVFATVSSGFVYGAPRIKFFCGCHFLASSKGFAQRESHKQGFGDAISVKSA